jgi:hypothetical protein
MLKPGGWYSVTEIIIKESEKSRTKAVDDWLRRTAERPLISILNTMKGLEPNLSAKTPVGMTMTRRQMLGTETSNPASKIERPNSLLNTGSSAGCMSRYISTSR